MGDARLNWVRSFLRLLVLLPVVGAVACNPAHGQVPEFAEKAEVPAATGEQTAASKTQSRARTVATEIDGASSPKSIREVPGQADFRRRY